LDQDRLFDLFGKIREVPHDGGAWRGHVCDLLSAFADEQCPATASHMAGPTELARLQDVVASLEAGLNALRSGLVLLNGAGQILFANSSARALLDARDGLRLERGGLVAVSSAGQTKLAAALACAIGRAGLTASSELALERKIGRPLMIRILPITAAAIQITHCVAAMVLIQVPDQRADIEPKSLANLGLTPSESRLVAALVLGKSLQDYAIATDLRPHTVRSTLRDAMAKTGTHSQRELISLVLRALAPP
jgi:DNA-binding CsgD family transcriptional regulator